MNCRQRLLSDAQFMVLSAAAIHSLWNRPWDFKPGFLYFVATWGQDNKQWPWHWQGLVFIISLIRMTLNDSGEASSAQPQLLFSPTHILHMTQIKISLLFLFEENYLTNKLQRQHIKRPMTKMQIDQTIGK